MWFGELSVVTRPFCFAICSFLCKFPWILFVPGQIDFIGFQL